MKDEFLHNVCKISGSVSGFKEMMVNGKAHFIITGAFNQQINFW